ncbi:MAG: RidA family protein [Thermodesulfobacteriota bacterium]
MKQEVKTDKAPAAIGPYSQAVKAGGMVFVSGQIPLNPDSGELISGDIQAATRQVLENLQAILHEAGCGLDKVVKVSVFLQDMADFQKVNEVYGEFFDQTPPARVCIQVAGLPKGAPVEMEAVALLQT